MRLELPRLVVGAASSGSGKTTLALALAAAFRARGLRIATFKCGPDYLDPGYHARASGGASHNLDGWMMGEAAVLATFARAGRGADLAVIEGVMGLFDGASPTSEAGSTAQLAKWLDAPVVAVLDASGMARTAAAVAGGLAAFDPGVRVGALVCNRIGGRGHLDLLRQAVAAPPVLGGLPARPELAFPERHLGLVTAAEALGDGVIAGWARIAEEWLDLDALLALARSAPALELPDPPARGAGRGARPPRCRIGVARDEAFHFYYEDNLGRLEAAGAELVPFSPVHDAGLPPVDGLLLGGGYPEVHAEALAANRPMLVAVRALAAARRPIYAECGGLMYLASAIRTVDGREHAMVGLLPGVAVVHERLQALGYAEVTTRAPTALGPAGLRFRGHEFRNSDLEVAPSVPRAYDVSRLGGAPREEGYALGSVLASYVHAHWASCPAAAEAFVAACARRDG
jgi:cobyrinic acid a,c-diamide synthase